MRTLNLKVLQKLVRGLVEGTLTLVAVPTGKAPRAVARLLKERRKPGRKALSPAQKRQRLEKAKALKLREEKGKLPAARDIFLYLVDKYEGVKLTALAAHFKVKRTLLKPIVGKLCDKGDLTNDKGTIYLQRRVRTGERKYEKAPPIKDSVILKYLADHPGATLAQMAKDLGEKKYQRFIRVANRLEKARKIVKDGKSYTLA